MRYRDLAFAFPARYWHYIAPLIHPCLRDQPASVAVLAGRYGVFTIATTVQPRSRINTVRENIGTMRRVSFDDIFVLSVL